MSQKEVDNLRPAILRIRNLPPTPMAMFGHDQVLNNDQFKQSPKYYTTNPELKKRVYMFQEEFRNNNKNSLMLKECVLKIREQAPNINKSRNADSENCNNQNRHRDNDCLISRLQIERWNGCSEIQFNRDSKDKSYRRDDFDYKPIAESLLNEDEVPHPYTTADLARYLQMNRQPSPKYQVAAFSELSILLKKVFSGRLSFYEDYILSCEEMMILSTIMTKKFDIKLPVYNIYKVRQLFDEDLYRTKKRPEECYKFVFKHAFKNLKRAYCDTQLDQQLSSLRPTKMIDFYEFYFGEMSKSLNVPLPHFYLPLTPDSYCNRNDKTVAKTINMAYANLISQSETFMRDFKTYLRDKLIGDYCHLITLKIDHMVNKWTEISIAGNQSDKTLFFICDYIKTNKKCKLPWTVKEVNFAIKTVQRMIERSNNNVRIESLEVDRRGLIEYD